MTTKTTRPPRRSPHGNAVPYPELGYLQIGKPMSLRAWKMLLRKAGRHFDELAKIWAVDTKLAILTDDSVDDRVHHITQITGILARARNHSWRSPPPPCRTGIVPFPIITNDKMGESMTREAWQELLEEAGNRLLWVSKIWGLYDPQNHMPGHLNFLGDAVARAIDHYRLR